MTFSEHMCGALPKALDLPKAFADAFNWAEERSQKGTFPNGAPYLSIYPLDQMSEPGASYVLFHFDGPPLAEPIPNEILQRYATVATAAGDGGTLGLWRDDDGKQQIVIFDHGWPYVLTDDPIKALQFLAIGYPEPAALPNASFTLDEAVADFGADPPIIPEGYQRFVAETLGVPIPRRASDLGLAVPPFDDMTDPMRQWMRRVLPA